MAGELACFLLPALISYGFAMIDQTQAQKMMEKVNSNLRIAIAIHALYEPSAHDSTIIAKYDKSYAANAFNVIRYSMLHMMIAALARIWDQDPDALSLPNLIGYLGRDDAQRAIIDRRRKAMLGLETRPEMVAKYGSDPAAIESLRQHSERNANKAEAKARSEIAACIALAEETRIHPVMEKLRNFRHKVIAHSLEITKAEKVIVGKGQAVDKFKYGDETALLKNTVPIVAALNLLVDDLHVCFTDTERTWRRYSQDFWKKVI